MALAELPANPIASMNEESLEARECTRVYDQCVEELLEINEWGFAGRRVKLALAENDRPHEWAYAYAMPNDCGTPRRVVPDFDGLGLPVAIGGEPYGERWMASKKLTDYIIEDATLYTNVEDATLEYGARTIAEAQMSALFVRALALEIASRIVMPIKKSREIKGDLIKQAELAKERAMADDKNRQPQITPSYMPEALLARGDAC